MSIKTWREEFYPIEAIQCTTDNALNHSLQKWIGLTKKNLKKHGCRIYNNVVRDDSGDEELYVEIDSESCALCVNHYDTFKRCSCCPLAIARRDGINKEFDYVACDSYRKVEETSPWRSFSRDGSPKKMIYWLRRAQSEQTAAYVDKIDK
jgi:hypothetical protein